MREVSILMREVSPLSSFYQLDHFPDIGKPTHDNGRMCLELVCKHQDTIIRKHHFLQDYLFFFPGKCPFKDSDTFSSWAALA